MIDKTIQVIVADATNGMSDNVTTAGDPTTTKGKPQTTSAGVICCGFTTIHAIIVLTSMLLMILLIIIMVVMGQIGKPSFDPIMECKRC